MEYKLLKNITLRVPILPYKYSENIEFSQKNVLLQEELEQVNVPNSIVREKYIKRMSYRTAPFNGMVSENKVRLGESNGIYINPQYHIDSDSELSNKTVKNILLRKSFYVNKDEIYYNYVNKEEKYIILRDEITDFLFDETTKNTVSKNKLIQKAKEKKIDTEIFIELIDDLINIGFLSTNISNEPKLSFGERRSKEEQLLNYSNDVFKDTYKAICLMDTLNHVKYYSDLVEYFLEHYNNSNIIASQILNDEHFLYLISRIKYEKKENHEFIKYIMYLINISQSEPVININSKDVKSFVNVTSVGSFDVHCNALDINNQNIINLDTLRSVKNLGNSNIYCNDSEIVGLNILSNDNIENYFSSSLSEGNMNINILKENSIDIEDLFVGLDISTNTFYTCNQFNERIKINKFSMLDINRYDLKVKSLLLLSDIKNLDKDISINYLNRQFSYIPRVILDNKFIVMRASWNIIYSKIVNNNLDKFKKQLKNMGEKFRLPNEVSFVEEDQEVLLNVTKEADSKFLFNKLKKNKKLLLKENVQKHSSLLIEGTKYSNEFILSFKSLNSSSISIAKKKFNSSIELLKPFEKNWLYLEIYLNEFEINYVSFLVFMLNEKYIPNFYYVIYKDEYSQLYLRIRFYEIDTYEHFFTLLNKYKTIKVYRILPYEREYMRYASLGIINFEFLAMLDTKRIVKTVNNLSTPPLLSNKKEKQNLIVANTLSILKELNSDAQRNYNIFNQYIFGLQDRTTFYLISNMIEQNALEFPMLFSEEKFRYRMTNDEELLSLIHMSNNRLIGTDTEIEKEVYKYLGIYYQKLLWRNINE